MTYICRSYDEDVYGKFIKEDGKYYNIRMREEGEKRRNYAESRRNNRNKGYEQKKDSTYVEHMENEDINTNEDVNTLNKKDGFSEIWKLYPVRQGKKNAEKHFNATVKNEKDFIDIEIALKNYLKCDRVKNGYIQNGSTWFNDWQSWIEPTEQMMKGNSGKNKNTPKQSEQITRATFRHTPEQLEANRELAESIGLLHSKRS